MIKAYLIKRKGRYTVSTIKGNNVRTAHNTKATITGVLKMAKALFMTVHLQLMVIVDHVFKQ